MLKIRFVYGNNDALLEISSAQNFGAPMFLVLYIIIINNIIIICK